MRGNGEWFIFVTLRKPGRQLAFADNILAVDLGCKNIATTVNTANTRLNYYGREPSPASELIRNCLTPQKRTEKLAS